MRHQEPSGGRYPFTRHQTIALVMLILSAVFIVENRHSTTIRFLVPEVTAPLWLALFVSAILGFGAGALLTRSRPS